MGMSQLKRETRSLPDIGRAHSGEKRDREDQVQRAPRRTSKRGARKRERMRKVAMERWWREKVRDRREASRRAKGWSACTRKKWEGRWGGREWRERGREAKGRRREARGYQERTSQVAVKWRIIIVASFVSRILCRTSVIKLPDTLRIPLVAVLKNYRAKYLKFPIMARTDGFTPRCILFDGRPRNFCKTLSRIKFWITQCTSANFLYIVINLSCIENFTIKLHWAFILRKSNGFLSKKLK